MSTPPVTDRLAELTVCPQCDAVHIERAVADDARAMCSRCGTVLIAPRNNAMARIVALAATALVLLVAALFFPFLDLGVQGRTNHTSLFDAVRAFSTGLMLPLSLAVAALIIVLPATRLVAILFALWPLLLHRPPHRLAQPAFRLSEALRPWAMAEVFIIGVAVALVKVAGLATVTPGPAFWAFAGLVLVTVLQDSYMCRHTIWKALDPTLRT